jgi:sec-independent protein translocase protein TatC
VTATLEVEPPPGTRGHDPLLSLVDHLTELRRRVAISLIAVAVGMALAFVFANSVVSFLVGFYTDATHGRQRTLIFTGPLDAFALRLKIAFFGGIVLALPVWLLQIWRFVTPALEKREKRYAIPFVASSIVLFVLGGIVAMLTLTKALEFLLGVGGPNLNPMLTGDKYVSLIALMIVAFGLAFEFPVLLMFLLLARVVSTRQLRRSRRIALIAIVVFAAVITPSQDPFSLFAMAIPMYAFYEGSILLGRILKR